VVAVSLKHTLLLSSHPVRADEPGEPGVVDRPTEEPGLERLAPVSVAPAAPRTGFWARRDRGPRLKLSYRTFTVAEMANRSARYHMGAIEYYIYSGILRTGAGLEAGAEDSPRANFTASGLLNVGVQYPCRLTPFADLTFGLGVVRRDVLDQDLVSFAWHMGLEGGVEWFVAGGVLVSLGVGWRREVHRHTGDDQVETVYLYYDRFTIKVGLGI